jgi:hypothetical protein
MDKVHKHNSINTNTPSSESYRSDSIFRVEVRGEADTSIYTALLPTQRGSCCVIRGYIYACFNL